MTRSLLAPACVAVLLSAGAAFAHHSAAGIDRTQSKTVTGTVKEFRWGNPHAWIDLDVTNDKGVVDTWSIEMTSPTFLLRAGWKSSTIKAGEKISATVRPFRDGTPGGLFVSVTLPDGRVMTERPPAPANPPVSVAPVN
ncbi:MAG TPA: DUF6152 family protein [Vicinamibacterales bacterium]